MLNLNYQNKNDICNWFCTSVEYYLSTVTSGSTTGNLLVDSELKKTINYDLKTFIRKPIEDLIQINSDITKKKITFSKEFEGLLKDTYSRFAAIDRGISPGKGLSNVSAYDLIEKIGKMSCPYCNLVNIENLQNLEARNCQLDHFIAKGDSAVFAICFYNLVPSCGICNKAKLTKSINASPYAIIDISVFSNFKWMGDPLDENALQIISSFNHPMDSNDTALGLKDKYDNISDTFKNLVFRAETNPISKISSDSASFPQLDFKRSFEKYFNVILDDKNSYKNVYNKATLDLLKQSYGNDLPK